MSLVDRRGGEGRPAGPAAAQPGRAGDVHRPAQLDRRLRRRSSRSSTRRTSSRWPTASRSATSSATTSAAPSLPREQALANAPKRNAESFLVPAVLE